MTITLFISILTIGAAVTGLLTETIKKAYANAGKDYSANMVALVDAIVVGGGGTAVCYMLLGVPWTVNNIICLVLMAVSVWMGSMIGYDKLVKLLEQLASIPKKEEKNEDD